MIITCTIHGDFYTCASSFLNSEEFAGCALCREETRKEKKKQKIQKTELKKEEKPKNSACISFRTLSSKNHMGRYDYSQTDYTGTEENDPLSFSRTF